MVIAWEDGELNGRQSPAKHTTYWKSIVAPLFLTLFTYIDPDTAMSLRSLKSAREIVSKLQSGSGAQKLSPQVTKISLAYAFKGKTECAGAK